ncbi:hypothetical protein HDU76_008901, partial [Blyttiomyces sp. JEL0837]
MSTHYPHSHTSHHSSLSLSSSSSTLTIPHHTSSALSPKRVLLKKSSSLSQPIDSSHVRTKTSSSSIESSSVHQHPHHHHNLHYRHRHHGYNHHTSLVGNGGSSSKMGNGYQSMPDLAERFWSDAVKDVVDSGGGDSNHGNGGDLGNGEGSVVKVNGDGSVVVGFENVVSADSVVTLVSGGGDDASGDYVGDEGDGSHPMGLRGGSGNGGVFVKSNSGTQYVNRNGHSGHVVLYIRNPTSPSSPSPLANSVVVPTSELCDEDKVIVDNQDDDDAIAATLSINNINNNKVETCEKNSTENENQDHKQDRHDEDNLSEEARVNSSVVLSESTPTTTTTTAASSSHKLSENNITNSPIRSSPTTSRDNSPTKFNHNHTHAHLRSNSYSIGNSSFNNNNGKQKVVNGVRSRNSNPQSSTMSMSFSSLVSVSSGTGSSESQQKKKVTGSIAATTKLTGSLVGGSGGGGSKGKNNVIRANENTYFRGNGSGNSHNGNAGFGGDECEERARDGVLAVLRFCKKGRNSKGLREGEGEGAFGDVDVEVLKVVGYGATGVVLAATLRPLKNSDTISSSTSRNPSPPESSASSPRLTKSSSS